MGDTVLAVVGGVSVIVLLVAHATFVGAEFGLLAVDSDRVDRMAEEGDRRARGVARALRQLSFHLSAAQLGITVTSLLVGLLAEPIIAGGLLDGLEALGVESGPAIEVASVVLALGLATVAEMVLAELVPKNFAIARPLRAATVFVGPLRWFTKIFRPVIVVLNGSADGLVRSIGIEPQEELHSVRTLDELELVIRSSGAEGTLQRAEAMLLSRAVRLTRKTVADVLVPRTAIAAVYLGDSVSELFATARETSFSRFPVFAQNLDDIVGVVHIKDGFAVPAEERDQTLVSALMRPALAIPPTRALDSLLREMRQQGVQMAVVVDEYAGTEGIVTIEDIVEDLVGEIDDEYDTVEPRVPGGAASGGQHVLPGALHRDDVVDAVGFVIPDGDFETIAGFVLDQLGHLPIPGETVVWNGWRLEVREMDGRRIALVAVTPPAESS